MSGGLRRLVVRVRSRVRQPETRAVAPIVARVPHADIERPDVGVTIVRVHDEPIDGSVPDSWASAAHRALATVTTRHALLVEPGAVVSDDVARELARIAIERGAPFVQPVVVDPDGLVLDAGAHFVARGAPPVRAFDGHLETDLPPDEILPAALSVSPIILIDLEGFAGFESGRAHDAAVGKATLGRIAVACRVRVIAPRHAVDADARRAWDGHETADLRRVSLDDVVSLAGLEVEGWAAGDIADIARRTLVNDLDVARTMRPLLAVRERRAGALRWALRSPAAFGAEGARWGDTPFIADLAEALRSLGQEVVLDARSTMIRPASDMLDDVSVAFRGLYRLPPNPAALNVLWVISHPELVSEEEIHDFDLVFAASESWAAAMDERCSVPVLPLLQAVNPRRFSPGPGVDELASDVLFVGRTRGQLRPIVRDAIAAGADLAVYGDGWHEFISPDLVRREHLDNDDATLAYRGARRVLNDHWADMAEQGFMSNRLFDAVASGARVVTDPIAGIERFHGAVRAYRSVEELRILLTDDEGWPDGAAMLAIAEQVAVNDSFVARATTMLDAVRQRR